jgi:hypothetical protein
MHCPEVGPSGEIINFIVRFRRDRPNYQGGGGWYVNQQSFKNKKFC